MKTCRSPETLEPPLDRLFRLEKLEEVPEYDEDGDEVYVGVPFWWIRRLAKEIRELQQKAGGAR